MIDNRSLDHERPLVACALQNLDTARLLLARVQAPMFADRALSRCWSAIARVVEPATGPVDMVDAVAAELDGESDVPGLVDLHELTGLVPSVANAAYYASQVIAAYVRREAVGMIGEIEAERTRDIQTPDLLTGIEARARHLRELLGSERRYLPEPLVGNAWRANVPDRQWLVVDWLPAGELTMLTGPGEAGKGLLALQLGAALACDREPLHHAGGWLPAGDVIEATAPDLCSDPVSVVLAGWEDDRHELLRRRYKLAMLGGCSWASHPSIDDRLHVLPMRGYGPAWAPKDRFAPGTLTDTGTYLLKYCEQADARLVVIDPVGLALALEENDRAAVSAALDELAGWAMRTGTSVLLVGHPAKATEGEAADYSGSTAWRGCARAMLTLRKPPDNGGKGAVDRESPEWRTLKGEKGWELVAYLTRHKSNYGPSGDALTIATTGGAGGWYLTDPLPSAASGRTPAPANGTGKVGADVDTSEV